MYNYALYFCTLLIVMSLDLWTTQKKEKERKKQTKPYCIISLLFYWSWLRYIIKIIIK